MEGSDFISIDIKAKLAAAAKKTLREFPGAFCRLSYRAMASYTARLISPQIL